MPVVARFDGIIVRMYLRMKEHNPQVHSCEHGGTGWCIFY